ncbi:hypothetical protein [Nocardia niigatensis]
MRPNPGAGQRHDVVEAANLHVLTLDRDGVARVDLCHSPDLFRLFDLPARV